MAQSTPTPTPFRLPGLDVPATRRISIKAYMFTENQRYVPLNANDIVLHISPSQEDPRFPAERAILVRPESPLTRLLMHICRHLNFPTHTMSERRWAARLASSVDIPDELKTSILNWPGGLSQIVFVCDETGVPAPSQLRPIGGTVSLNGWLVGDLLEDNWHDWFQPDFPEKKSTCKGRVIKSFNYQSPSGAPQGPPADLFLIPQHRAPGNWLPDRSVYNPYGEGPSTPFSP
jgi:hypothetical protein